jgi:hypothetical protein
MATLRGVVSSPFPPFQNVPINPQFFKPSRFVISAVALGITTTVTTTVNHNYVIGQDIRLIIPPSFGCIQLNETKGIVLSIPAANQVIVSINSSMNVDPYIASTASTPAQILAIGDINAGQTNANGIISTLNFIPGSFQNISPL